MIKELQSQNEQQNEQIKRKRRKVFLLALLFALKFLIIPWLQNKIINYCLKSGSDYKKTTEEKNGKGFSLIEIMIVFAVAGIMAGLCLFSFSLYRPALELSNTSKEIISNMRYAQQLAVSQQINYGVYFYPSEKKYQVIKCSQPEELIKNIFLPSAISLRQINFTDNKLIFNIYGAAVEAGSITIENNEYSTSTVEVKPSGFIKKTD
ncbi:MAG: prepilin-type N-terminal cleavage/methylation domain-containing protein [Candidatus Pacebacteria bacterium]|nr:prepilin-type N-terminal cleavage/methylation domain-containing protein [Candidatus Paceibacterota bacterium]MDD4831086.1 prepilin-type N-terminal cleavage/methylation domain-containing protein [Candidatus Paceibacterota bacterium]MDD4875030.1 prepilin-type N-terminal cleavage/methylation domain-containing protein [Candidatus Paceibacterota bacterium]